MLALTVNQPYAWAIAHAGKDVENRTWKPPPAVIGTRIAIHASRQIDGDAYHGLRCDSFDVPHDLPLGAVVATARVAGWILSFGQDFTDLSDLSFGPAFVSSWFTGPIGWVLRDVRAFEHPITDIRGKQRLWRLDSSVEALVRLREAST
jgi:hypothetical protein